VVKELWCWWQCGYSRTVTPSAAGHKADETVLDLVNKNDKAYVLSNDRFGDFNAKHAVRCGRIIRHEIVNGNIFVHDLQIKVAYR
jgi:hypothetical protein